MIEYSELMDTDPNDTKLKSIHLSENGNELIILYEEEKKINISLAVIISSAAVFVLVTYMIYLLIIGHQLMERKRQQISQNNGAEPETGSAVNWD